MSFESEGSSGATGWHSSLVPVTGTGNNERLPANCKATYDGRSACRLGTPFPDDMTGVNETLGDEGWKLNCYANHKIDDYWVKHLENDLKIHVPEIASRGAIPWN
jgi:hypothetical protein